jgi:hypothetical protein
MTPRGPPPITLRPTPAETQTRLQLCDIGIRLWILLVSESLTKNMTIDSSVWNEKTLQEFIKNSANQKDFLHPNGQWTIDDKKARVEELVETLERGVVEKQSELVIIAMRILSRQILGSEQIFSRNVLYLIGNLQIMSKVHARLQVESFECVKLVCAIRLKVEIGSIDFRGHKMPYKSSLSIPRLQALASQRPPWT